VGSAGLSLSLVVPVRATSLQFWPWRGPRRGHPNQGLRDRLGFLEGLMGRDWQQAWPLSVTVAMKPFFFFFFFFAY
jgi:hypothetical protein